MDPVILASARRHGVADDAMLHAYRNPIRVLKLDDLTMLIEPDKSANFLELELELELELGVARAEGLDFIVHAMVARARFLE